MIAIVVWDAIDDEYAGDVDDFAELSSSIGAEPSNPAMFANAHRIVLCPSVDV